MSQRARDTINENDTFRCVALKEDAGGWSGATTVGWRGLNTGAKPQENRRMTKKNRRYRRRKSHA